MRPKNAWFMYGAMSVCLVLVTVASILFGSVEIPFSSLSTVFLEGIGVGTGADVALGHRYIITELRVPRALFALFIGGALSISGAMMQGLFRNPLADPGLLGVSSGAALGAASVIVMGWTLPLIPGLTLPVAAFIGGIVATGVVMSLSLRAGQASVANMLLAGIAINALCGAATGLLVYVADDEELRTLTFWTMGSLGGSSWADVPYVTGLALLPALIGLSLGRSVNALLLGESEARLLGVNVEQLKYLIVVLVCTIMGTSVALTGMIGFVGLVVPHLCRMLLGSDNRSVFLGSLLLGSTLLLGADLLARIVVSPAELPIGIVTSVVGGPFFLFLLYRSRQMRLF
jgi:iron complex transport system permease protein